MLWRRYSYVFFNIFLLGWGGEARDSSIYSLFMLIKSLQCYLFRSKLCLCSSYLVMQEKEKVAYLFVNPCFTLLGPQARTILMQSSLPQAQLATIW